MEYHIGRSNYLMRGHSDICQPLVGEHTTDVVVVGGGMAGLFAAKELVDAGKHVILIEKTICGGGMSGRSGGFLTPDSELGLRQVEQRYGKETAKILWDFGQGGQDAIVELARGEGFMCDVQTEDSLLLGWKKQGVRDVEQEFAARQEYGYDGQLVSQHDLHKHTAGKYYTAGVRYSNCFAINPLLFCQEMKHYLMKRGVKIYENTILKQYAHNYIKTSRGEIHCKHIVFAMGKVASHVHHEYAKDTYGIQNFITMSEPLSDAIVSQMFPQGKLMCRDTKLAFTYFRFTGDNRLVLGGGNLLTAGLPWDILYPYGIQRVIHEVQSTYPDMENFSFEQYRNGRIETTKDMMPIVDRDDAHENHWWIQGCVGLPRAAASGRFAVQQLLADGKNAQGSDSTIARVLQPLFLRSRRFRLPWRTNSPLVKSILYGVNNLYTMKKQQGY